MSVAKDLRDHIVKYLTDKDWRRVQEDEDENVFWVHYNSDYCYWECNTILDLCRVLSKSENIPEEQIRAELINISLEGLNWDIEDEDKKINNTETTNDRPEPNDNATES